MDNVDAPELAAGDNQTLYVWRRDGEATRHNLTCVVDARPQPQIYWTRQHQHRHHEQQKQQQQQLHSNDTFQVFQLNSTVTVLQVELNE